MNKSFYEDPAEKNRGEDPPIILQLLAWIVIGAFFVLASIQMFKESGWLELFK